MELEGYKLFRQDRLKQRGGGVCVYIITSLKTKVLKELSVISDSGFQQFWSQIQHKKLKSIILCVLYKPPNCPVSCFVDDFMDNYTRALMFGKEILVVGDLNCYMLGKCPEADALNDLCRSLNVTQLIKSPTRITSESSTLIDIIMTSNGSLVTESGVEEIHTSNEQR